MTVQEFRELLQSRVPTPAEFLAFAESQGWSVSVGPDGRGRLRAKKGDTLAVSLARMLGREPYRTGVLAELQSRWRAPPPTPAPDLPAPREWLWRTGHRYREEADDRHPAEWNPVGANWWRRQGESGWRLVEGLIDVVVWIDPGLLRSGRGLPAPEHLEGTVSGTRGPQSQPVALARA